MNRMPSSPRLCIRVGISFGRWKADQKNSSTSRVLSSSSSPGLPNATLPTLKNGVK